MNKAQKKEKSRERIETRIAYTTCDIDWLFGKQDIQETIPEPCISVIIPDQMAMDDIVEAFNGQEYFEVKIEEGFQVDIPISIDTSTLPEDVFIYIFSVPILDEYTKESPTVEKTSSIVFKIAD